MITTSDLIELMPRKIKYKDKNYYISISYDRHDCIFMMDLYREREVSFSVHYKDDMEEIRQNYIPLHTENIDDVVNRLGEEAKHSLTYIQDVIQEFFKMYLESIDRIQAKETQIKIYKEWDGNIE